MTSPAVRIALCALLPLVAVSELVAAEIQHRRVPTDREWHDAAAAAKALKKPGDMVLVAPRWASPLGRKAMGEVDPPLAASMIDTKTVGRSDLDTVTRVLELSIRGDDDPQTKGWRLAEERTFGHVKLRVLENPKPEKLLRDLVDELTPDQGTQAVKVSSVGAVEPCRWETTPPKYPNLFQGPPPPPQHFLCAPYDVNWTFVGVTMITDLNWVPRRCMLMHPTESNTVVNYPARPIGKRFVGYTGIHVFSERDLKGSPYHVRVTIGGKQVVDARHQDGDGWKRFEASTAELAGQSLPIKIETFAEGTPQFRVACVAAQLRD